MARKIVLGINGAHDAAACIVVDGELVVAVPEERLSRVKYHEGYPFKAVDYCLRVAGLRSLGEVDSVVINRYTHNDYEPEIRRSGFDGELVINPSHHLLHAYYAWVASDFRRPAVLVLDGSGYNYGEYERRGSPLIGPPPQYSEMEEAESMYAVGEDGSLELVRKKWGLWDSMKPFMRFPSLGHMFSAASQYIFGHFQHAGKTMGLAPYGDASAFPEPFIEYDGDDLVFDTTWVTKLPPRSDLPAHLDPICRNLAAKVQEELEPAVIHLCKVIHEATGSEELALSGGVGLNSVANGLILRQTPFSKLFVTPASGDSGIAIGAALYGYHRLTGDRPRWRAYDNYHGQKYDDRDVADAVAGAADFVRAESVPRVVEAAVADLVDGKFVGWFEGASEFGPRALGHRSIICDPRPGDMRDRLNARVKFREPFRPYAASVLAEHVKEYFDVAADDPFMMTVAPLLPQQIEVIRSVCHVDDTCRIQTVDPEHQGLYRRLIEHFHEVTGVPMVLNTSFNIRGEPIVETPQDAIRCFLSCNLDVLYLNGLRITKLTTGGSDAPATLVPHLVEDVSLAATTESVGGGASVPSYFCRTRTGQRVPVDADEYTLLHLIDAERSIAGIAAALPGRSEAEVVDAVDDLRQRGMVRLARAAVGARERSER
ncbi:carbamoyltransferase C-terminal domain-containing protein [Streptomyces sp. BE147]|uniref:carbamoyltransferase family protein n=1 Tax=Streptomyces sp. BE147 TaxID=3002524 RepID=UPI002E77776F|nr:carbamoyltransferase C-terminal domain-containing protein [Streptomyces sp. BE147]MEE1736684.1 carbamoyltransferase C-terminal domain-containing protein [Streptomyces sp. BE147]